MSHPQKNLLILGASGLLGSELSNGKYLRNWNIIRHGRALAHGVSADLSIKSDANKMLGEIYPDVIINLIGMTNVDKCEQCPNLAYTVNVKTIENVVNWINCADKLVYLVHISTDQVYDGAGPHSEEDVSLCNYYAFSKYMGELVASTVNGAVLRTNFFGKTRHKTRVSITDWLFNSLTSKRSIQVFDDVHFSPISMSALSELVGVVVDRKSTGTFNVGARGGLSKSDFAYAFAEELSLPADFVTRTKTSEVSFLKAYRPKDMRMNLGRFERAYDIILPDLREEIKRVAQEYKHES